MKKHRIIGAVFMLMFACLVFSKPVSAETVASGTCGARVSWTLDSSGLLQISGRGKMVFSSDSVPWADYRSDIRRVVIEENVINITDSAFSNCYNLTSITIPEGVTSIGEGAFRSCTNLSLIELPSGLRNIDQRTFYDSGITSIVIPGSVRKIGEYAFQYCSKLRSVEMQEGVVSIETRAFYYCSSLLDVTFPTSLESISDYSFSGCSSLSRIYYNGTVSRFCKTLSSTLSSLIYNNSATVSCLDDDGTNTIHCYGAGMLNDDVMWANLSNGDLVFWGEGAVNSYPSKARSVSNVVLVEGISEVGDSVFNKKTALTNVTIPESLVRVGSNSFYNTKVDKVYYFGSKSQWKQISGAQREFRYSTTKYCYYGYQVGIKDEQPLIVRKGTKKSINYTIDHETGEIGSLNWGSDDKTIATVTSNGEINGIGLGETDIYALADNGVEKARIHVAVVLNEQPEKIHFLKRVKYIPINVTSPMLEIAYTPEDTTDKNIKWESSDNTVVQVKSDGSLIGKSFGKAVITATLGPCTDSCEIEVVGRWDVNESSNYSMHTGDICYLDSASCWGGSGINMDTTWTSSNTKVINVDSNGYAFAIGNGTATLTGRGEGGVYEITRTIDVTTWVTGVSLSQSVIQTSSGSSGNVQATVKPSSATNQTVTWSSSDSSIVSITSTTSNKVYFSAVSGGVAYIKATTADGGYSDQVKIVVNKKAGGTTGKDNIQWTLVSKGDKYWLYLEGEGELPEYSLTGTPWLSYMEDITAVYISDGITAIGEESFAGSSIQSITLPKGVAYIGANAFHNCTNLKNITLPTSVKSIGAGAFEGCNSLKTVYYYGTDSQLEQLYSFGSGVTITRPSSYRVYYKLNGGVNAAANPSYYTSSDEILLEEPTREGYSFEGWYKDSSFRNRTYGIEKGSYSDKYFYAKWSLNKYTIDYTLNGGKNHSDNPSDYTYETQTIELKNPVKPGYTFTGWYCDEQFENKITSIPKGSTGSFSLFASWKEATYSITYKLYGGVNSPNNPKEYNAFMDEIDLEDPTRDGFIFDGWYQDSGFKNEVFMIRRNSEGNRTFYAKWIPIDYSIQYVLNGGSNSEYNKQTYNASMGTITLYDPSRKGYNFAGWFSDESLTTRVKSISKGTLGDLVLYAKWELAQYSISYVLNGGNNSSLNPNSYNMFDDTITLQDPSRSGAKFGGWFSDYECQDRVTVIEKGSTGNRDLYAKWVWSGSGWELDHLGTLRITDNSVMKNYTSSNLAPWYSYRNTIKKVIIDDSVSYIGNRAFYNCYNLKDVVFSKNLTIIGEEAFYNCISIKKLDLPNTLKTIKKYAFQNCSGLQTVTVPGAVQSIGSSAFDSCSSLQTLVLPGSLTSLESQNSTGIKVIWFGGTIEEFNALTRGQSWISDIKIVCSENPYVPVTAVQLSESSLSLQYKETKQLVSSLSPESPSITDVSWESSNEKVVTVDSNGNITGISAGNATIKAIPLGRAGTEYATCTVSVSKRAIKNSMIEDIQSSQYSGEAKTPEVILKDGSIQFEEGIDYTVSYKNNVNAGTAKAVITGKGQCTGTIEKEFSISAQQITGAKIKNLLPEQYNGEKHNPELSLTWNEMTLIKDKDYKVSFSDNVDAGDAKVAITGIGNYCGETTAEFQITPKEIEFEVENLKDQEYTGETIKPLPIVKDGDTVLQNERDYELVYFNNQEVGTAQIVITGKGNYSGALTCEFEITPKSIQSVDVFVDNCYYTGEALQPIPRVKDGEKTLEEGIDYTLSYTNNINSGNATLTLIGMGRYTDKKTEEFTIEPRPIDDCRISGEFDSCYYTGEPITQKELVVEYRVEVLKEGEDYTVSYLNNNTIGKASFTIMGIGNYSGQYTSEFQILKRKDISELTVTGIAENYRYTGSEIRPVLVVTSGDSRLEKGVDYTITYSNNTQITSGNQYACIYIEGINDYTGTVTKHFKIIPNNIANAYVQEIPDQTFTGSGIRPATTVKLDNKILKASTDYYYSYSNNVHVGTASIEIHGMGGYSGTIYRTFRIIGKSIAGASVSEIENQFYTGSYIKPSVSVYLGSDNISDNCTIYYFNNADVGTASVHIFGKGDYTGLITKSFTILPRSIEGGVISFDQDEEDIYYTGEAYKPVEGISLTMDGDECFLDPSFDKDCIQVSYSNNKNVGKATATITGIGNYTGTITKTFIIHPENTDLRRLIRGKKCFTVKWKKQKTRMSKTRITGYQIQYSLKKSFKSGKKVKVKGYKKTSRVIRKLKANKRYYVRIRTFI